MDKTVPLTREGHERLLRELEELRTVRRKEVADRIHAAKELAATQNDAEYEDAKNAQAFVEGQIQELEAMLTNAVIIDEEQAHNAKNVQLGSRVTVLHEDDGREQHFTIVGPAEANPHEGRISHESPVGRALIGRRKNEKVEVSVPSGIQKLKVLKVE
jgi:transcription elongation factor GreA